MSFYLKKYITEHIGNFTLILVFCLSFISLLTFVTPIYADGVFVNTGSTLNPHYHGTATILQNGKVLVAGGVANNGATMTTELYDPTTGTWSFTGNLMQTIGQATATLLPNGKVLVAGGFECAPDTGEGCSGSAPSSNAELYDPSSGTWSYTGSLPYGVVYHTATLLPNGKVLVAGGESTSVPGRTNQAELYDPATGIWTATGGLLQPTESHTATLLQNGKVLVAGGDVTSPDGGGGTSSLAELYDPATGTWSATGNLQQSSQNHTATLLQNGKVLIAGGDNAGANNTTAAAELYDPSSGTWSFTGSLPQPLERHTATLLPNGEVLVAGGFNYQVNGVSAAELYDPISGTWSATGSLQHQVQYSTATLLTNGKVLIEGGFAWDTNAYFNPPELYDAGPTVGTISIATSPVQVNTPITASASFTYGNPTDTNTASWNWGDGNTTAGTVTESNGSGSVSNTHTYTITGVYTITLTVTDSAGASSSSTYQYVAVYDPSAGFVTGSGKYDSLAGWDNQNPTANGDLKVGFHVKYVNNVPTGKTKIDFKNGNLELDSTSYNWLVISGDKATFEGNGTINDTGNYNFLISGIDGSQGNTSDKIRVRITDQSNNVVYDSQMGAPDSADPTISLDNGSIKIH